MKRFLLILVSTFVALAVKAQSEAYTCRYWFDQNHAQADTAFFGASGWEAELDVGQLADGLHTFYLHVQVPDTISRFGMVNDSLFLADDTVVMAWSTPQSFLFLRISDTQTGGLTYHCWFDQDTEHQWTDLVGDGNILLDANSLEDGVHTVNVMVDNGILSSPASFMFLKMTAEEFGADMRYICWFDQDIEHQWTDLVGDGNILLDANSLEDGVHTVNVMVDNGILSSPASYMFLKMTVEDPSADLHYFCWFDQDYDHVQTGLLGGGIFELEASDLSDGIHTLNVQLERDARTAPQTYLFYKIPSIGYGMARWEYWVNEDYEGRTTSVLTPPVDTLDVLGMLPVGHPEIRSSCFHFHPNGDAPFINAKNQVTFRFWDTKYHFFDKSAFFVDEYVQQSIEATVFERNTTETFPVPFSNQIRWFKLDAAIDDSLSFLADKTCTMQLFAPSGDEVLNVSDSESIRTCGIKVCEDGTYYLAVHDVTGSGETVSVTYNWFARIMISASVNLSAGGTVSGAGYYYCGTNVTLTATANPDYEFVNWTENNEVVSTDAIYSFEATEDRSLVAIFRPSSALVFIGSETDHNWSTPSNWNTNALPAETDDVFINGICELDESATVASLTVNAGKSITVKNGNVMSVTGQLTTTDASQLVVENGGQLVHNNDALATVKKFINGYVGSNDNYYLIASPVTDNTSVANLTANEYDLYTFDQSEDLEWRNQHGNAIVAHKNGYLYANSEDVTLEFAGTIAASAEATTLEFVAGKEFTGFNLIGNPFPCNAYIEDSYLRMNEEGTALEAGSGAIAPCEAVFVEATAENQSVAFSKTANRVNAINISVSRNRGASCDRAIVRFDGKSDLHKMTLTEGNAKLYIPQFGEDFAVVCSQTDEGEMPVNFKAAQNGTYTIAVNTENVTADYLHLIDNLTGEDVNLLEASSYVFEAKVSDYASRFKLVFSMKDTEPAEVAHTFAFISNGEIIISNEGRATLQLIDAMGRIIRNQQIEGEARISTQGLTAGVYVITLNGMTQKIVVK